MKLSTLVSEIRPLTSKGLRVGQHFLSKAECDSLLPPACQSEECLEPRGSGVRMLGTGTSFRQNPLHSGMPRGPENKVTDN